MEIIINNKEFDESEVTAVKKAFRDIINQLTNLNLSTLQSIIIPNDFGKELIEFQQHHRLREGYTNNEFGIAVGKVLTYLEVDEFKTTIFFDPRIIYSLFNEDKKQNAIHLIHHEFCHVHDDSEKYRIFGVTDLEHLFLNTSDRLSQITYAHADLVWSEYVATRLSAHSFPKGHDFYIESLIDLIPKTKELCEKEIHTYRIEGDITKLFGQIQLQTSLLLKIASYFIGYCHGLNGDIPDEINKFVKQHKYLYEVWDNLSVNLHRLYDSYGKWDNEKVFSDLANIVLNLWGNLGLFPRNKNGQLFISVP